MYHGSAFRCVILNGETPTKSWHWATAVGSSFSIQRNRADSLIHAFGPGSRSTPNRVAYPAVGRGHVWLPSRPTECVVHQAINWFHMRGISIFHLRRPEDAVTHSPRHFT